MRYTPLTYGNIVYGVSTDPTGNTKSLLYAVDKDSGKLIWNYEYKQEANDPLNNSSVPRDWSSPLLSDGRLYVASGDGHLYTLDAVSGDLLWKYEMWKYEVGDRKMTECSTPIVSNNAVYVFIHAYPQRGYGFYALIASNGELMWKYETAQALPWIGKRHTPIVTDGVVYGTSRGNSVYARNALTGALLWLYEPSDQVLFPPSVSGEVVYISTRESLHALDASSGKLKWQWFHEGTAASSPLVDSGTLYLSTTVARELGPNLTGQRIYAIDIRDGVRKPGVSNGQS